METATPIVTTAAAVARLGVSPTDVTSMTDDSLLHAQKLIAEHSRIVDSYSAWVAGEIARRSTRELGHSGLAARQGFGSPVELVQSLSHVSRVQANKFIAVGISLDESPASSTAVSTVGVEVLDTINRGLGTPDSVITASLLERERARLIELSRDVTVDELYRRARMVRDELDAESVERREREQRDRRYWKHGRRADGMVVGSYLLDAEQGALLSAAFQNVLSPRRSGPRFDDARTPVGDERTDEQFAADALVAIVQLAVDADTGSVFGTHKPAVSVLVREEDLAAGSGFGVLEDSRDPVSMRTVERLACESGILGILFDAKLQAVDVGREKRLHTRQQRRMLAARDGGCMFPNCDMPVSMTQVHHPDHWRRDRGGTSVENGILLCAFHHLMLHNNGWEITLAGARYWLIPPVDVDPEQRALALESKNPLLRATG